MQSFEPIFNENIKILLEILEKEVGNGYFDIGSYLRLCTLDMVCGTFLLIVKVNLTKKKKKKTYSIFFNFLLFQLQYWVSM